MKTKVKHTTKILRLNHTDGGNESMAAKVIEVYKPTLRMDV